MDIKIIDGHMHIARWMRSDGKNVFDCIETYQKDNKIQKIITGKICSDTLYWE